MLGSRGSITLATAIALMSCGDDDKTRSKPATAQATSMLNPADVEIGPVIKGANYSKGLPLHPSPSPMGGWQFDLGPNIEPHYVTFHHGSLAGKTRIEMTYTIEGGGLIQGAGCPGGVGWITLYFQARDDDWATDGRRWWATFAATPLAAGDYAVTAGLDSNWTSVMTMTAEKNRQEFEAAKLNADRVGFTFGNCEGYGHGIRATEPGTFRLTGFNVT